MGGVQQPKRMTEEEELALALQASVAEAPQGARPAAASSQALSANGHGQNGTVAAADEPMQSQPQPEDDAVGRSAAPGPEEVGSGPVWSQGM